MSPTAEKVQHSFDAARAAGREPFKVKDLCSPSSAARKSDLPSRRCPA